MHGDHGGDAGSMLSMACAWCRRVQAGERWIDPREPGAPTAQSHGICQDCAGQVFVDFLASAAAASRIPPARAIAS